ncbi:M18 family aminopeptidase [Corynebacterium epidermidicanis]|uniref:M18 family aminopeptidase n=1 Tax=Corynebacterium epidermidicanis TaxID=1050174 RepID=A0A0G3GWE3_9CORY|nr:M18 family aminopeptidase [Corynebacterium epidermidicanis]AKK03142.1 aspartyl aminopeptidase [Corynebacterium epidermidicanis]
MSESFLDFIAASPSSFHAAEEVAHRLERIGFVRQEENEQWDASPGGHVMVRGGAVVAWWVPEDASPRSGFRIIGSHTDSPGFKAKPLPELQGSGFQQIGVEIYGGPILASWFDRELQLAGRIELADGSQRLVTTEAMLRIPHLAIHLDRGANDALHVDKQAHTQPIFAVDDPELKIMDIIAASAGVNAEDIVGHDLITVDGARGVIFGPSKLIAAGRMDNLSSVYASLQALINAIESGDAGEDILVLAAFDHEEVGSATMYGAAGPILEDVLVRTGTALGADTEGLHQMYARSTCVSADAAHSIHPNYAARHDAVNYPVLGQGPVLKVNANQRYATDARSAGMWQRACAAAGVPSQVFAGNNNSPCGSTIGPITATRLGVSTVDVGIPLLSMHSARELASAADMAWMTMALESYLVYTL